MFRSTIFNRRFFVIFLLLSTCNVQYGHTILHQSHLCEPRDMPCDQRNPYGCRMKYYRLNSSDCGDMPFDANQTPAESTLGRVQVKPYQFTLKTYKQTGLNVSFSNITWKHLKFRFKQEGNSLKNTCREFSMSANSSVQTIFYDCLWSREEYEGTIFSFEYQATNSETVFYKKYLFRVPFEKNIRDSTELSEWEIFIYVEVMKNSFGLTTFIVHWQPLPARFSVNSYYIKVFSKETGPNVATYQTNVTCDDLYECKYYYNKWYGNVQFGVEPICKDESPCLISKTAVFLLGGENAKPLLIGIVSITAIVPATIYIVYLLRGYLLRKSKKWSRPIPKLLVIFSPSLPSHVNVVFALVEYLKMYCHVEPLLDQLHIFHSKSRDPFKWCNEAFRSADIVMVVASPYHRHLKLGASVYLNTDVLLLRFLRERLACRDDKTQFFVAMLPYCSEPDIPEEAVNLRRYAFPKDLNKMLRFIHKESGNFSDCLTPEMSGGKETYKMMGEKVRNAIDEAQSSLRKNRPEYDRMVEEMRGGAAAGSGSGVRRREREGEETEGGLAEYPEGERRIPWEFRGRGKSRMKELAEGMFGDFPGLVDDMNLSGGEEGESLMGAQKASGKSDAINLDVLEL